MFIFRTISQPRTLSADIPAAGWGLFTNYQHNIMTKQNHICSFLTLLFLKSLCQSSIFTQHKILTYWKQKHPSLLLSPTKFPWSCNHNNYYYNNIIKIIDGTLWELIYNFNDAKDYELPRTGGSVSWAAGCYAGGREFNSGRTNTQGLKITE